MEAQRCINEANSSITSRRPSYWHQPGTTPLLSLTVGQLLEEAAERWQDVEALVSVHEGVRMRFHQVRTEVDRIASGLLEIGLKPGDRIGIWGPNTVHWYLTFLAAARAGLISVTINPAYQAPELLTCINQVGIKCLVAAESFKTQNYHKLIQSVAPELEGCKPGCLQSSTVPTLKTVVIISQKKIPGCFRFCDVIESPSEEQNHVVRRLLREVQPDEGCNIQFTSGTTGRAKATLLSHHGIVNNAFTIGRNVELHLKNHRICLHVPLFHCFGNVAGILSGLHHGTTLVLPSPGFDAQASYSAIHSEKCTILFGTPTMHFDLLAVANQHQRPINCPLEIAVNAGAPCSPQLSHKLIETFGLRRICAAYGMTETSPLSFQSLIGDSLELMTTTAGHVLEHIEVKVVNEMGRIVDMGTPGELWVRGYSVMLGYWGEEAKTRETIRQDRWMRTGDLLVLHENGYGQVVGRIKDMIIRGGENIFPTEIEKFLELHSSIQEAQVFGVDDPRLGEVVCACIRLEPGVTLTDKQIKDYCTHKIAHFKIPQHIKFVENFPTTISGKIQKFRLQEMFQKEMYEKANMTPTNMKNVLRNKI